MSIYHCSITGEPAEFPVVSKKSGHVFEKRAIEKYIDATQICPITNQSLTREDLVAVQIDSTTKPRSINKTGVADVMTIFQSEYDALMLESQVLKQNLETARQELSHTLYQHDAACRVIAKLLKERNEAQEELDQVIGDRGEAQLPEEEEAEGDLPKEVIEQIVQKKTELNAMRKERKRNPEIINNYASKEMIGEYTVTNSLTLHSTTKPGITCLDIHPDQDEILVTGGNDGAVIFYNKNQDKIIKTYEKHHKKITDVKFVPNKNLGPSKILSILSCEDGIGNMLVNDLETGELAVSYRMNQHKDALVGCTVHPLSYVGLFCAKDGTFSFHDLAQGQMLSFVTMEGAQFKNIRIHPDGHIAAIGGQDGVIRIWDILGNRQAVEMKGHNGPVDSLNFSENGVNFATSSFADKTVKLWDLRNLEGNCKTINENAGGAVNFDQFGQFLAVGTSSLRLYNVKDQEEFMNLDSHKDTITSIQFGAYSKYIATVSLDRHLTIYS